ncbi:DUF3800 domain-containing protein [Burkholderia guangdongensis]|uniref:DUF3800 domain-containing protein n=1 Tax=Burkholderia guangdongensis TaxID=1792500 RepID=UPI0031B5B3B9
MPESLVERGNLATNTASGRQTAALAAVFIWTDGNLVPYICYIDEAGCSAALPAKKTNIQPLLVIAGLIVQQDALADITREFLALKRKYFPGSFTSGHLFENTPTTPAPSCDSSTRCSRCLRSMNAEFWQTFG